LKRVGRGLGPCPNRRCLIFLPRKTWVTEAKTDEPRDEITFDKRLSSWLQGHRTLPLSWGAPLFRVNFPPYIKKMMEQLQSDCIVKFSAMERGEIAKGRKLRRLEVPLGLGTNCKPHQDKTKEEPKKREEKKRERR